MFKQILTPLSILLAFAETFRAIAFILLSVSLRIEKHGIVLNDTLNSQTHVPFHPHLYTVSGTH